ncbi:MAG: NAD-dependent epimerase/dehydratase family protein [Dehalococcoidia bacterium]
MTAIDHVLVTGGAGFIGTHLTRALLDRGLRVTVVTRSERPWRPIDPRARALRLNLAEVNLDEALADVDAVYHLAWASIPATADADPARDVVANVPASIRLAQACVRAGVRFLGFTSSGGAIYGDAGTARLSETAPPRPISSYGISKLTVEHYLALYRRQEGLNAVAFRPSNAYGPLQDPAGGLGALTAFTRRTLDGEPIEIWGDGTVVRDFLYVSDLVDGMVAALARVFSGDTLPAYNLALGASVSLNDLAELVFATLGARVPIRRLPPRPFDVPAVLLDTTRARTDLGWTPRVGLAEGIARVGAWLRAGTRRPRGRNRHEHSPRGRRRARPVDCGRHLQFRPPVGALPGLDWSGSAAGVRRGKHR